MIQSRDVLRIALFALAVCPLGVAHAQDGEGSRTRSHASLRGTILQFYPSSVLLRDLSQREYIVQTRQSKVRILNRKTEGARLTVGDEVVMTGPARSF